MYVQGSSTSNAINTSSIVVTLPNTQLSNGLAFATHYLSVPLKPECIHTQVLSNVKHCPQVYNFNYFILIKRCIVCEEYRML